MNNAKNSVNFEGYIVTGMGLFALVSSLMISDNPVKMTGWIGFAAQARFLPLLTGLVLVILGVKLILDIRKCRETEIYQYKIEREGLKKLAIVIIIVSAYLFSISIIGFFIPTLVYFLIMLFYLNYKIYKPITIIGTSVIFFVITYYLVPMMLKIQLP